MAEIPAGPTRAQILDTVITAAASSNMHAAIQQHGHGLTAEDTKVLTSLTPQEIQSAVALKQKLAPLAKAAADNNGGVF